MIPPMIMRVKVVEGGKTVVGLWLPLFVVWFVLAVAAALLLPLLLMAIVVCALIAPTYVSTIRILPSLWGVLCSVRGTRVEVDGKGDGRMVRVIL